MREFTNGSITDLVFAFNTSANRARATIECHDGPWLFEHCDVRSACGIAVIASAPDVPTIDPVPCDRHATEKPPYHGAPEPWIGTTEEEDIEASETLKTKNGMSMGDGEEESETSEGTTSDSVGTAEHPNMQKHRHKNEYTEARWEMEAVNEDTFPSRVWPPCTYEKIPRRAIMNFTLCAFGGIDDTVFTRASIGIQADERSSVHVAECTVEDTYQGVVFSDMAIGWFAQCRFSRNGVAVGVAECAKLDVRSCLFQDQRLAHLQTILPPELVSVWAIDGGPSGYGTISRPEYGVGTLQDAQDKWVKWEDTVMDGRDPTLTLIGNAADGSARLWWSGDRPGSLRGQHGVGSAGCECGRMVCGLGCEPQCEVVAHRDRRRDAARRGVCPLLAQDNAFARGDDNFDPRPKPLRLDAITRALMEGAVPEDQLLHWERHSIAQHKRALEVCAAKAAAATEEEKRQLQSALQLSASASEEDEEEGSSQSAEGSGVRRRRQRRRRQGEEQRAGDEASEEDDYEALFR